MSEQLTQFKEEYSNNNLPLLNVEQYGFSEDSETCDLATVKTILREKRSFEWFYVLFDEHYKELKNEPDILELIVDNYRHFSPLQWLQVYKVSIQREGLEGSISQIIYDIIRQLHGTFSEWHCVYIEVDDNPELSGLDFLCKEKLTAIDNLMGFVNSFLPQYNSATRYLHHLRRNNAPTSQNYTSALYILLTEHFQELHDIADTLVLVNAYMNLDGLYHFDLPNYQWFKIFSNIPFNTLREIVICCPLLFIEGRASMNALRAVIEFSQENIERSDLDALIEHFESSQTSNPEIIELIRSRITSRN